MTKNESTLEALRWLTVHACRAGRTSEQIDQIVAWRDEVWQALAPERGDDEPSVCDRMGHRSRDVYEDGELSHSVCDECGAEMFPTAEPGDVESPEVTEAPRNLRTAMRDHQLGFSSPDMYRDMARAFAASGSLSAVPPEVTEALGSIQRASGVPTPALDPEDTDPSPRSWSLPAPPPDDVTVEYRVRHLRSQQSVESPDAADLPEMKRMYRVALAQGEAVAESRTVSPWRELPVVEGEPQAAEPPRFAVGDRVRVRQSGKVGTVTGHQGAFVHVHLDDHPDIKFMSYDADKLEPASEPERWRTGRKVGRTLYRQVGEHPSDADPLIGVMDTPELAARVVAALAAVGAAREEKERS